jgi:hypothetical protein
MRIDRAPGNQANVGINPTNANRLGTVDGVSSGLSAAADQAVAAGQFQPTSGPRTGRKCRREGER